MSGGFSVGRPLRTRDGQGLLYLRLSSPEEEDNFSCRCPNATLVQSRAFSPALVRRSPLPGAVGRVGTCEGDMGIAGRRVTAFGHTELVPEPIRSDKARLHIGHT